MFREKECAPACLMQDGISMESLDQENAVVSP
jgi:hypothetical protein